MMNRVATKGWKMLVLPVLLLPLLACSDIFMDEQHLMQKAAAYLEQRNINAAIIELKNALQENPENAQARYLLAELNLYYGDFETAIKEYRRAEGAGWSREETTLGIARSLLGLGRFKELRAAAQPEDSWKETIRASLLALQAVGEAGLGNTEQAGALIARAREADPMALQVLKAEVQLNILAGNPDKARDILQTATGRYPDNQELLLLDASLYQRAGDTDKAAGVFRRIIDIDPPGFVSIQGYNARLQLAQLQIIGRDFSTARTTLRPVFGRNPNDPLVNYLGGVIAFQQHDYPRAEQRLLKVLKLAPEHNPTRLLYGTVNFAEGNYEQAAYFLSKYLIAVPDNLVARKLLARSYILLGRGEEAHATLQTARLEKTDDAELMALVGLSELARGERHAGIAELEKALRIDTGSQQIRTELARAYIDGGNTGLAIRELKSMLAQGGQQLQTEVLLVLAHLRAGDFSQAISGVLELVQGHREDAVVQTLAGNVFAASGDYDEARRYLERALQLSPGLPPALLSLASIEELEKHYPAAIELYRRVADMDLPSAAPMLALARVAEQQGNPEVMVSWLQRAIEHVPDDNQPRLLLAEHYLRSGSIELARPLIQAALENSPRDRAALAMLGRLRMLKGDYAAALKPLNQLLEYEPDSVPARTLLGECYLQLGRHPEAREQLEAALDAAPDNVAVMALLARLEIINGAVTRALDFSQRIQAAYPELYLGYELEGDSLMANGNYAEATRAYARASERLHRVDLVIKRAESASRSGNDAAAAGYLQDWLAEHPDDVRALQTLGETRQTMGMPELAIAQYERVLALDDDNAAALNNLAGLYQQAGRPEALALAARALKATPDNPGVMDTYAWILLQQQGNAREALRLLEEAARQLSDNPEVRFHYAVALYQAGDRDKGRRLLKTLLDEGRPFEGRDEAERMLGNWQSSGRAAGTAG